MEEPLRSANAATPRELLNRRAQALMGALTSLADLEISENAGTDILAGLLSEGYANGLMMVQRKAMLRFRFCDEVVGRTGELFGSGRCSKFLRARQRPLSSLPGPCALATTDLPHNVGENWAKHPNPEIC